ncbi:hypothetical protein PFISCL1PPCAC_8898, partial [Pristionchus fissidentatus]
SVMNFVRSSKKHVFSFTALSCDPDQEEIIQLPTMSSLLVQMGTQSFSDQQVLSIARKEHEKVSLRVNLSDPMTLRQLIKITLSSNHIRHLTFILSTAYFLRFLASIGLREEGNQLFDVSDHNTPVLCLEMGSHK